MAKDFGVNKGEGHPTQTSLTLLDKVRRQEKEAWGRLVSLYTPLVCHWCKRAGLRFEDMEEVVQEVFLAVARNVEQFQRSREGDTFRGWLRTITKNKIVDHAPPPGGAGVGGSDAHLKIQALASLSPFDGSDPDMEAVEKNILYNRAVELIETSFEYSTRRAFWLLIAGKKPKDVALELGITPSAVYTAKSKILKHLREEFRGLIDQDTQKAVDQRG